MPTANATETQQAQAAIPVDRAACPMPENLSSQNASPPGEIKSERWATSSRNPRATSYRYTRATSSESAPECRRCWSEDERCRIAALGMEAPAPHRQARTVSRPPDLRATPYLQRSSQPRASGALGARHPKVRRDIPPRQARGVASAQHRAAARDDDSRAYAARHTLSFLYWGKSPHEAPTSST